VQHRSCPCTIIIVIIGRWFAAGRGVCRYRACLPWHSRLEHCAGFHQSPLWQWQMLQSSTFTSMPAGIIVVPAKQFGPAKTHGGNRNKYPFLSLKNDSSSARSTREQAGAEPQPLTVLWLQPSQLCPTATICLGFFFSVPSGTKEKNICLESFLLLFLYPTTCRNGVDAPSFFYSVAH